jgi:IclR family acetate operon transcriptional repressor
VGKALLVDLDEADLVMRFGRGELRRFTVQSITTLDQLIAELLRVRARGYAYDDEEMHPGVRCLAAPVRGHLGQTVAAIGISGPIGRLTRERLPVLATAVRAAAQEVSLAMGFDQQLRVRA